MSIPTSIKASRAAARSERYTGDLPLKAMSRLIEALADTAGDLHAEFAVTRDVAGQDELRVQASGKLRLTCQRCLKGFDWTLNLDERLRLVTTDDEEARALHDCEPYRVNDDALPLRELLEDEVLLVLPMMPRCETCENAALKTPGRSSKSPRANPFADLKQKLKH